jgi:hypothetical protein
MSQNKIIAMNTFFDELVSESSDPGAGINNDDIAASGLNLEAGGVTTILTIFLTRNRYGSS